MRKWECKILVLGMTTKSLISIDSVIVPVLDIGDCKAVPTGLMRNSATKHESIGTKPSVVIYFKQRILSVGTAPSYDFEPCMISETMLAVRV
jgi:hypothetical protein